MRKAIPREEFCWLQLGAYSAAEGASGAVALAGKSLVPTAEATPIASPAPSIGSKKNQPRVHFFFTLPHLPGP